MADGGHTVKEMTDRAAEAFRDYVALGPDRSLEKLAIQYQSRTKAVPTKQLSRLKIWSTTYGWQDRIATAATERSTALLAEANEIDAESFAITSRKLRSTLDYTDPLHLDAVVKIRETVRGKSAGVGVNVNVNVAIYQHAQRLAERLGITAEELIADAEKIAAEAWNG